MAALEIIQNTTGFVNPSVAITDTGWSIDGVYANHISCNSGTMKSLGTLGLVVGRQYTITYTVDNWVNGSVKVIGGTTNGTSRTANGTYTETLTIAGSPQLSFFSDGTLRISKLMFYDTVLGPTTGTTISFNEGENQWGSDYSFHPEFMIKFIDQFLTLKDGQLWLHDTNETRGNFYGEQFPAEVDIVVNVDFKKDKLFYNIRLDGKGKWYAPTLQTVGSNQFPNGMLSRLKKNNFSQIDGKLWAAILRDITDPNYSAKTDVEALFNARMMQGGWMLITFRCDDTGPTDLSSLEVYYTLVHRDI